MAAIGFDVDPKRGDLEVALVDHSGDGAVRQSGRNVLDSGLVEESDDLFRAIRGGDVDIELPADIVAREQGIAHAAADKADLLAPGA
jgi:hypothetical protein